MNRTYSLLSIMSFLAVVSYSLLMFFDVLSPIIHLRYFILIISVFFTFLSLGLFSFNSEVNKFQYVLYFTVLILPVFIPLIGLFKSEVYSNFWRLFIGGTIFQIGTGIYAILGGFIKKSSTPTMKVLVTLNYFLFIVMAFSLIFNAVNFTRDIVVITSGAIVSLLSLILVLVKNQAVAD